MAKTAPIDRVQDTAKWVAMARAIESERRDAVFKDPYARGLAGSVGEDILQRVGMGRGSHWPIVARTYLIDRIVRDAIHAGADAVLNLAAGLDTRPYRMELPKTLTWIEVDHADVIAEKDAALKDSTPTCKLERIVQDLSVLEARRALFAQMGSRFGRVFVMTEGLLPYLTRESALSLATDLIAVPAFFRWVFDLPNAAVLRYVAKRSKAALQGTAAMQFGPDEGPVVFEPVGWKVLSAESLFKVAGRLHRLPFIMSLFAKLPEKPYGNPKRPWSGVCVMEPAKK